MNETVATVCSIYAPRRFRLAKVQASVEIPRVKRRRRRLSLGITETTAFPPGTYEIGCPM